MAEERSLWEIYDSEEEPWRKGRFALILIGLFCLLIQGMVALVFAANGQIEAIVVCAAAALLFWLFFYFVWIGIHWLRWIWGAWILIWGFCSLIWAFRDGNGLAMVMAGLILVIGCYLSFSPNVYVFAKRQRETTRWVESLLIGIACFMTLFSVFAAYAGIVSIRVQRGRDMCVFADEANQRIYHDRDFDWILRHVTPASRKENGEFRLRSFLEANQKRLGSVGVITPVAGQIRLHYHWPLSFSADGRADCPAETDFGPIEMHALLQEEGDGWALDRMWWEYRSHQ